MTPVKICCSSIRSRLGRKPNFPDGSYTMREILVPVFRNGACIYKSPSVTEIADYCRNEKKTLWDETKRLFYPHEVHVDLSPKLYEVKKALLDQMAKTDRLENGDYFKL